MYQIFYYKRLTDPQPLKHEQEFYFYKNAEKYAKENPFPCGYTAYEIRKIKRGKKK